MYQNHIEQLGLPAHKKGERQIDYVKRVLLNGTRLNTRICRFIGIGNLHSIISRLASKRFPHCVKHGLVTDPYTGEVPPYEVDIVWMEPEQIQAYRKQKATVNTMAS